MLKVKLVILGKLKEKYWRDAEIEYLKRLGPHAKLEIIELKDEAFSSPAEKEKITRREAEKILGTLKNEKNVFLLHEGGIEHSSLEFSGIFRRAEEIGAITFVIGGPLGLHGLLLKHYPQISLSRLTFTHQMARVILLEQIYRAITIIRGKQYHY